jgi:hypothetical protein
MLKLAPKTLMGYELVLSDLLTESYEDWSACRSPSRARRRERQGHPQRVRRGLRPVRLVLQVGDRLLMHSETYYSLQEILAKHPTQLTEQPVGLGNVAEVQEPRSLTWETVMDARSRLHPAGTVTGRVPALADCVSEVILPKGLKL